MSEVPQTGVLRKAKKPKPRKDFFEFQLNDDPIKKVYMGDRLHLRISGKPEPEKWLPEPEKWFRIVRKDGARFKVRQSDLSRVLLRNGDIVETI